MKAGMAARSPNGPGGSREEPSRQELFLDLVAHVAPSRAAPVSQTRGTDRHTYAAITGANSSRVAGANPKSRSTRFNPSNENFAGVVISIPIG